jgi:outer membrane protein assembly factor BamD
MLRFNSQDSKVPRLLFGFSSRKLTNNYSNTSNNTFSKLCLILSFTLLLGYCGLFKGKDDPDAESERALYQAAQTALNNKQYSTAIDNLRKIELRYPFGRYAEQAQLETLYAYYQNDELAAADVAAERFMRQYPEHPNLDYAQYIKGLANYHVDKAWMDRFLKSGSLKRDLSSAKVAYQEFKKLIERFPESDYVADAQKRIIYLRDIVSRQEIEIANYYMQRAAYVAAVNRAKAVIESYPGTSASADALAVLVHAYQEMGMNDLAIDSLKVLQLNFPNYEKLLADGSLAPYDKIYHDEVNWINFISFGLLNRDASKDTRAVTIKPSEKEQTPRPKTLPFSDDSGEEI